MVELTERDKTLLRALWGQGFARRAEETLAYRTEIEAAARAEERAGFLLDLADLRALFLDGDLTSYDFDVLIERLRNI